MWYFSLKRIVCKLIFVEQGAARAMMEKLGDDGLVVDGRKLFFEYRFVFPQVHNLSTPCFHFL